MKTIFAAALFALSFNAIADKCDDGASMLYRIIDQRNAGVTQPEAKRNMNQLLQEVRDAGVKGTEMEYSLLRSYVDYVYEQKPTKAIIQKYFIPGCRASNKLVSQ